MSVSKTARLDIYIKERSVALIFAGSQEAGLWRRGGRGGGLLLWRWFTLNGLKVAQERLKSTYFQI